MKKLPIFILCCFALVFSSMAQNATPKFQHKGKDWYEPDTIYTYKVNGFNMRYLMSYKNGVCIVERLQMQNGSQWEDTKKNSYVYDEQNNLIEHLTQIYGTNQWQNFRKFSCIYNAHGNLTEELSEEWQVNINQWVKLSKYTYAYDAQNNMIEKIFQRGSQLENAEKHQYTYNHQNNITEEITQRWWGQWENETKGIYTYDTHGNKAEFMWQLWKNEQWVNDYNITYSYDVHNNMIEDLLQKFGIYSRKISYSYDERNNMTEEVWHWWNVCENIWKLNFKYLYSYDAQNNIIAREYHDELGPSMQDMCTYDTHNNLTEVLYKSMKNNQWENRSKINYSYDENNNSTAGLAQRWDSEKSIWIDCGSVSIVSIYYNNMQSSKRLSFYPYKFSASYIKTGTVSVPENPPIENVIKLYPNPVSTILNIETGNLNKTPEIKIYSVQGVLLMSKKGNQIDVSSLQSGIYIVEVEGVCKKIVKH